MARDGFSRALQSTRRISIVAPILSTATCVAIVVLIATHVHIASVFGTTAAATIAACATFTRSHYRTQRYVRFAIRARLSKKAEPNFEKFARQIRTTPVGKFVPHSSHPSPEIREALFEAEQRMGMRKGSTMALVVPLELILGVPHNCPAAAAMLYAGKHPVILVDDNLQLMLDAPQDHDKAHNIVVSVLCHELAHLVGWNTRWSRLVSIGELFVTTAAMAAIVAYGLEHNFAFGIVGAVIAAVHLASEPALRDEESAASPMAVIARLAFLAWVPYVLVGLAISALPIALTFGVTVLSLGLRFCLAFIRRQEEYRADLIAAHALGTSQPLTDFFRTLSSAHPTIWSHMFASHPLVGDRIKNLTRAKIK